MYFPSYRMRRLRASGTMRRMVRETALTRDDLIYPLFVFNGEGVINPVPSMPGIHQFSVDLALEEVGRAHELGLPAVMLFGLPRYKDETGSSASDEGEAVQEACRAIKKHFPQLVVITDVCLCGYTDHGHCGLLEGTGIDNDSSLEQLGLVALSHARAGADMVAPSNMMDGQVQALRAALDGEGFAHIPIMAYAAKYASSFYGPFRDAAESSPQFGDRKSYQMDPANSDEALREIELDIAEGADIVMVKPALAFMDIISRAKDRFRHPLAAYNVSGEYAMIKAAAAKGWLDERETVLEVLCGLKRAGADLILTYFAPDAARWLEG